MALASDGAPKPPLLALGGGFHLRRRATCQAKQFQAFECQSVTVAGNAEIGSITSIVLGAALQTCNMANAIVLFVCGETGVTVWCLARPPCTI